MYNLQASESGLKRKSKNSPSKGAIPTMPATITAQTIQELARANGLEIPEERLELVKKDYEGFLQLIQRINTFPLDPDAEPMITFSTAPRPAPPMPQFSCRQWPAMILGISSARVFPYPITATA
jgi:hypothetical protein